ncbi:RNA polymerase sigma-70 factor [Sinomicrobium weinanense]|uniref:RNA polymerase sigma-70 factor n=1 Tax=Sinomicrobium weinanense TaxID=2842200 RepID=A0A926Q3U3_9FLAO|nr:RNA polymerase sigma-70 factor [Sinomicrobium weinanense]MBC9796150.1 RNA polymerase sigma-70 factor [Sinomicrobium weinanense]MBU3121901.1 RNA polymerase sigma-70 factor [Sinomicrobium weinanense]
MNVNGVNNSFFLHQLKKGEEAAFEALFHLYFEKLHHFAHSYIENSEDAREIVQNTFYKLWRKRATLPADLNLNAYLFSMVKNDCLDYFKHLKVRYRYREEIEKDRARVLEGSLQDDPSLQLIESELLLRVNRLIDELPPACREIFIKSRFEGLKYKEIARELNISPKTVENQISKALRHLRKELAEYLTLFF